MTKLQINGGNSEREEHIAMVRKIKFNYNRANVKAIVPQFFFSSTMISFITLNVTNMCRLSISRYFFVCL